MIIDSLITNIIVKSSVLGLSMLEDFDFFFFARRLSHSLFFQYQMIHSSRARVVNQPEKENSLILKGKLVLQDFERSFCYSKVFFDSLFF